MKQGITSPKYHVYMYVHTHLSILMSFLTVHTYINHVVTILLTLPSLCPRHLLTAHSHPAPSVPPTPADCPLIPYRLTPFVSLGQLDFDPLCFIRVSYISMDRALYTGAGALTNIYTAEENDTYLGLVPGSP